MKTVFATLGATLLAAGLAFGDDLPEKKLIELSAKPRSQEFQAETARQFTPEQLRSGEAWAGYGPEFLWVIESKTEPRLFIDDRPAGRMEKGAGGLWIYRARLETGRSHAYQYVVNGKPFGKRIDVRAYGPDSYPQPGASQGKVTEKMMHTSQIYPGMKSEWWYYVSPGVEPGTPAAVMVWQDGHKFAKRLSPSRLFTVTENLVRQGKIPPMIHVLVSPGYVGEERIRSIEYDTVSDRYPRFIVEEILPLVEKEYKLRKDAYSRGIGGESSGGICSLNAAWQMPNQFSRVVSRIGSYTAIAWRSADPRGEDLLDGGHSYPNKVRKEPKRNIRIWMEDGYMDLENSHGSWPLQNVQLANSLKMREYDFKFVFGNAQHNTANGDSALPEALAWLWRDYDPARTGQTYAT